MMNPMLITIALIWCGSARVQEAAPGKEAPEFGWDCPSAGYLPYRRALLLPTEDLGRMMEEGALIVLHVGFDETKAPPPRRVRYTEGHLPGARYLSWTDLAGSPSGSVPLGSHASLFASLGVTPESRVVFYDTGQGREAAAAYAALDALGLGDRGMLLDGQFSKWAFEGRPISLISSLVKTGAVEPRPAQVGITPEVVSLLWPGREHGSTAVSLIDARQDWRAVIKGEGGGNCGLRMSWTEALVSPEYPVIAGEARLRRVWSELPSWPDQTVIVAAQGWAEAAPVYFLAKLLGYTARLLDGSIDELQRREGDPGEAP